VRENKEKNNNKKKQKSALALLRLDFLIGEKINKFRAVFSHC